MKALVVALAVMLAATDANAWTVASTWEQDGDDYVLTDSVLGTWCVVSKTRTDGKNTRVYEQNQKCFSREWIVISQGKYRTKDRMCEVHEPSTISERYHKNLVVFYKCQSYETNKEWFETAEFGFARPTMEIDQLYIIRY